MPADRVQFVVAYNGKRRASVDHRLDRGQHLDLLRAAVNKIADKNRSPRRVPSSAIYVGVTHFFQQGCEAVSPTVNVTNQVVHEKSQVKSKSSTSTLPSLLVSPSSVKILKLMP